MKSSVFYNYYKLLDLPVLASPEDIKKAYRNKAKQFHPDVNSSPKAHEYFVLVNEAYEVLMDDNKRYLYDLKLKYRNVNPAVARPNIRQNYHRQEMNFHYDWRSIYNAQTKPAGRGFFTITPFIYNLFFASGMFVGFLMVFLPLYAIYSNLWPSLFVFSTIPGIILVTEGWNGITGKKSFCLGIIKTVKKVFTIS